MVKSFKSNFALQFYVGLTVFLAAIGFAFYKYQSQIDMFITISSIFFIVIILPVLVFYLILSLFFKR